MRKDEFQRVRSGEPLVIPAATYNAMLDAAQANRNRKINLAPRGEGFDSLFVYVLNATGRELSRFDILGLDGPVEPDDKNAFCNRVAFRGVVPTKAHRGKFAVIQQDAKVDQVVRACVYGVTPARIKAEDDESKSKSSKQRNITTCDIEEGTTGYLVPGGKFEVLWSDAKETLRWAYVRIGGAFSILKGELAERCKKNAETVKVKTEYDEEIEVSVPYPDNLRECPKGHKCRYYSDSDGWALLDIACPPEKESQSS